MKISAQDRNTALTISIVLVVCIISLIAIGSFLWRLIQPGLFTAGEVLGVYAFKASANYNFDVPAEDVTLPEDIVEEIPDSSETNQTEPEVVYDYNFKLPSKKAT